MNKIYACLLLILALCWVYGLYAAASPPDKSRACNEHIGQDEQKNIAQDSLRGGSYSRTPLNFFSYPGHDSSFFQAAFASSADNDNSIFKLIILAAVMVFIFRHIIPRSRNKGPKENKDSQAERKRKAWLNSITENQANSQNQSQNQPSSNDAGLDQEEFLQGAKATFIRLQYAWDRRDLDDLGRFMTKEMLDYFHQLLQQHPEPEKTKILQLQAKLMHLSEENSKQTATVYYEAITKKGEEDQERQIRQIWEFIRDPNDLKSFWLLNSIEDLQSEPVQ